MRSLTILFFVALTQISLSAFAFPEMIRLGYVNCTACHISPTGGGLLTDYGRAISAEALSTWTYPREEAPGHGLFPDPPSWLKIGGGLRVIQTYVDTPRSTATSFFLMQSSLELGLQFKNLWYVQSLALQGGPTQTPNHGKLITPHYYLLYNWSDVSYVRGGKYLLPYGLTLPDHTSFVRRHLGFDQGQEAAHLEVGTIGETWNALLALSLGQQESRNPREKGVALQLAYNHGDTHKLMASFASLKSEQGDSRILLGPQILWGFNSHWVFLGEYDYQEKTLKNASENKKQQGLATYSRLQYEWTRGVTPYLLHQLSYLDFTQLRSRVTSYGAGVLLYPRPHFEIITELTYSETAEINSYSTVAWILGHYYF